MTLAKRLDAWLDLFPAIAPYSKTTAVAIIVVAVTYFSHVVGELVRRAAMKGLVRKNLENNPKQGRRLHYSAAATGSFACAVKYLVVYPGRQHGSGINR